MQSTDTEPEPSKTSVCTSTQVITPAVPGPQTPTDLAALNRSGAVMESRTDRDTSKSTFLAMEPTDVEKSQTGSWFGAWVANAPQPQPRPPSSDELKPFKTRDGTFMGRRGTNAGWRATSFEPKNVTGKGKTSKPAPSLHVVQTRLVYQDQV